jgi:hypothetical protein
MWTPFDPFDPFDANVNVPTTTRLRGTNGEIRVEGYRCSLTSGGVMRLDRELLGGNCLGDFPGFSWEFWTDDPVAVPSESPDPDYTWTQVRADEIQPGDYVRADRTNEPGEESDPVMFTMGTVSQVRRADSGGLRVTFAPGSIDLGVTRSNSVDTLEIYRTFFRRSVVEPSTSEENWREWDPMTTPIAAGTRVRWTAHTVNASFPGGGEGIYLRGSTGVAVQLPDGLTLTGLSSVRRSWYRWITPTSQTEGEPQVTETWSDVNRRDIRVGDVIRLSRQSSRTDFPAELTGTVTRNMPDDYRVDLRLLTSAGGYEEGRIRRGLSTNPDIRAVQRRSTVTADAPATPSAGPVWVTLPTDLSEAELRRVAPLQTPVRYRQFSGDRQREGWVTGYGTAGYDITVNPTQGNEIERYGAHVSHGIDALIDPAVLAAATANRPSYDWTPVTDDSQIHLGMRLRGTLEGRDRQVEGFVVRIYTPEERGDGRARGLIRQDNGRVCTFQRFSDDALEIDASTAPVVWGSSAEGWANVDRRVLQVGDRVRSTDNPVREVGTFVSLDNSDGVVTFTRDGDSRRSSVSPRYQLQAWNDGTTTRNRRNLLTSKDHLTLAGLKAAVFEFAKAEGDMYGTGTNCNAGTNEFLDAVGLPRQTYAPLVDESAEIDAFLRRVQEYLSRDSIGITREKADRYLEMWGLPKAPRRRRVQATFTLDGETTDAQIIERIPRVIRDAMDVRVRAA